MNKETKTEEVKVTVLKAFRDKFDRAVLYSPGQELELDAARAEDIVSRGLAEYTDPVG